MANPLPSAGVPQIVLPVWADTYDYAYRAEMLGVGRWGNKTACPRWSAAEFGDVLVDVAAASHERYAAAARLVAEKCRRRGRGRDNAAEAIHDLIEGKR